MKGVSTVWVLHDEAAGSIFIFTSVLLNLWAGMFADHLIGLCLMQGGYIAFSCRRSFQICLIIELTKMAIEHQSIFVHNIYYLDISVLSMTKCHNYLKILHLWIIIFYSNLNYLSCFMCTIHNKPLNFLKSLNFSSIKVG